MTYELQCRKTCGACGQSAVNDPCDACYKAVRFLEERARAARRLGETMMLDRESLLVRVAEQSN